MSIRIGIDCLFADPLRVFGLWNHALTLIRSLVRVDQTNEYVVFLNGAARDHFTCDAPNVHLMICSSAGVGPYARIALQNTWLLAEARRARVDLLHSPANYGPVDPMLRRIVTTHDLLPFFRADGSAATGVRAHGLELLMRLSLRSAKRVIAASHYTAAQLQAKFSLCPERLRVVHLGVAPEGLARESLSELRTPYLLVVGLYEAHKNIPRLIQAFAALKSRYDVPHRLILVGRMQTQERVITEAVARSGYADWIDLPGYVEDDRLQQLYIHADLYVCPSVMEGFGLPLVEAMNAGTPVVCSNAGSLAEIVGVPEAMFDPRNTEQMVDVLRRGLTDQPWRAHLRAMGKRRAEYFSAERMARETLAVYLEAVGSGAQA
jgi:glycosyltransferase involved in cell wall biosynthesis